MTWWRGVLWDLITTDFLKSYVQEMKLTVFFCSIQVERNGSELTMNCRSRFKCRDLENLIHLITPISITRMFNTPAKCLKAPFQNYLF